MKLTNQTSNNTQKIVITFCLAIIVHFVSASNLNQYSTGDSFEPVTTSNIDTTSIDILGPMTLLGVINIVNTYVSPLMNTTSITEAATSYLASSGIDAQASIELSTKDLVAIIEKANYINQLSIDANQYFLDEKWEKLRVASAEYLDLVGNIDTPASNTQLFFYSKACYAMSDYVTAYAAIVDFLNKEHISKSAKDEVEFDLAMISITIDVDNPNARLKAVASNYDNPYHRDAKAMIDHF